MGANAAVADSPVGSLILISHSLTSTRDPLLDAPVACGPDPSARRNSLSFSIASFTRCRSCAAAFFSNSTFALCASSYFTFASYRMGTNSTGFAGAACGARNGFMSPSDEPNLCPCPVNACDGSYVIRTPLMRHLRSSLPPRKCTSTGHDIFTTRAADDRAVRIDDDKARNATDAVLEGEKTMSHKMTLLPNASRWSS